MKKRALLMLLAAIMMLVPVFAACQAAPQEVTWIFLSPDLPYIDLQNYLNNELPGMINTASGGLVTVEWRPTLYSDDEYLWPMSEGKAQIAQISPSNFATDVPEWEMNSIPFLFYSPDDYDSFSAGGGFEMYYNDAFDKYNLDIVALSDWSFGTDGLWSKKPVKTAGDFKGMKISAEGAAKDAVELLDGSGQKIAFEELYLALDRGVIDGVLLGAPWGVGFGFQDVAKYYADWPIIPAYPQILAVNKTAWNALPKNVQTAISDVIATELTPTIRAMSLEMFELQAVKGMLDEVGVTYTELDLAEIAKAQEITKGIIAEWANKTPECMKLLRKFEEISGRTLLAK